ncbi:MAG: DNA polymerase III subunit alpha [Spirochaetia bacterium]|nr:DNA polymerase III subunit alpha [Spirochaetia bacterium]
MAYPAPDPPPVLAARSYYSLLRGALSPERVAEHAARSGFGALALTDLGNLYALPAMADAAAERGLGCLAGAALERPNGSAIYAWALDRRGYGRLCGILSRSLASPVGLPHDALADLVAGAWDGLALATDDEAALGALAAAAPVHGDPTRPYALPFVALLSGQAMSTSARLARRLGLPPLAVAGGRTLTDDDDELLPLLGAIDRRLTLGGLNGSSGWRAPGPEDRLPDAERVLALYSAYPEALDAARALARDAAPASSFFSSPPAFPSWRGLPDAETFRALRSACQDGAARRYAPAGASRPDVAARLERELAIIRDKGFAAYFLVVRDIVAACPRTCGRGSAASSIVSYLLGLTHVDPLAHDLFFERFLNEGRTDPPDIDIDFPWDERPAVLKRVFSEYRGRSAMVADHCRFSGASRVREGALALGMDPDTLDREVSAWRHGGTEALAPALARAARLLKGVPRYIGTHPGGVVITPGPMDDYAHVQPGLAGYPVLAWEKDGTERAGLVKIDLLGNRSLAVLRDCIELCSREPGAPPEATDWERFNPVDEPSARALIESGNTIGVFYIESPATRQLLAKMRRADYGHLVAASSIIRPAANRYINEYVRRMHGGSWKRMPDAVEACLADTYGIMVYQEDVSRVAMAAAGFQAAEADALRKTLTKKRGSARLAAFRERFEGGCAERGVSTADADELWSMMLSFDGYSFCKSHSASYALVSYRLAWMKANRPGYFMASVINNGGGFYGTQAYLGEAGRLGFRVLPPGVNHSGVRYAMEGPDAIRTGLCQVVGLSSSCAAAIERGRQAGDYADLADFLERVRPSYDDFRVLARSGCLDGLPSGLGGQAALSRPALLWAFRRWERSGPPGGLFPDWSVPDCVRDYPESRKLADEADFLGVIVSRNPASLFAGRARSEARRLSWPEPSSSSELGALLGRRVSLLGVAVAGKEVLTHAGAPMCFRSFSDEAGVYECVVFPQAYRRLLPMLEENGAFLVLGSVRYDHGAVAVHVEDASSLNRSRPPGRRGNSEHSRNGTSA